MQGLDLVIEYPNVFPDDLCDEMIERFEEDDRKSKGHNGSFGPEFTTDKVSIDLYYTGLPEWVDIDTKSFELITPYVAEYVNLLSDNFHMKETAFINDQGYQIQRTDPGGFFSWHCDHTSYPILDQRLINTQGGDSYCIRDRIATYIIYLNDRTGLSDGVTEFGFGDNLKTVTAEKGKLIMFPANILYPHRGTTLENGVKYLMTGWVVRDAVMRSEISPQDYEERFERYERMPYLTPVDNR
ncbi:2OG-Fe(II) oxygenase [Synechococcus phage ACG-2014f]|uniref:2OG-Fe(II) oxygenase n=2 Tax=Atlauavirus TaxID=2733092 RepID=A0A0E3I3F8_9CAUD|nr:2OG-Fe(II) oxygenase [Synechococcus phage ACG-2014f_Syn7803US26]AIX27504.1 2OG-Fe(II) oxygenase [Synechococcus phage ACG-2014f]AIX28997.1 2OG-Fe(II) oxygenase [Synechococcus phage ACG-2014f_Syn7803US26]AIX30045.1 2OG-Fe(II) oxygenase [Synechococcus phage ACG-2014f]AIX32351.1 2OG-Fe(II) oxygenase [Synechococcus phage ACG-2014f]AIX33419.1 2OG-Fe(II) oxygenase [Synechococcus phage ACG-2014f]